LKVERPRKSALSSCFKRPYLTFKAIAQLPSLHGQIELSLQAHPKLRRRPEKPPAYRLIFRELNGCQLVVALDAHPAPTPQ